MRLFAVVVLALLVQCALGQQKVETSGITAAIKLEEVLSGYLNELNGKFKFRVTEVTIAPGGHLGVHHHAGPGIRVVMSGEVTFAQAGKAIVYKTGDYFYESGNVVHTAHNKTKAPVRIGFIEVLPVQWSGTSLIPPKAY